MTKGGKPPWAENFLGNFSLCFQTLHYSAHLADRYPTNAHNTNEYGSSLQLSTPQLQIQPLYFALWGSPLPSPLCLLCAVRAPERNGGCSQGLALLFIRFQWYLVPIFASLAPSEASQAQSRVFPDPWKIVSQNWLPFPPPQTTRSERPSFYPTTFCSLLLQSSRRALLFTLILLFWSV